MHYIYGLANPLLDEDHPEYIFYVGEAMDPLSRLGNHLANSQGNEAKYQIISQIFKETHRSPLIIILERCPYEERIAREREWEYHYREINPNLTNANLFARNRPLTDWKPMPHISVVLSQVEVLLREWEYPTPKTLYDHMVEEYNLSMTPKAFRKRLNYWTRAGYIEDPITKYG